MGLQGDRRRGSRIQVPGTARIEAFGCSGPGIRTPCDRGHDPPPMRGCVGSTD